VRAVRLTFQGPAGSHALVPGRWNLIVERAVDVEITPAHDQGSDMMRLSFHRSSDHPLADACEVLFDGRIDVTIEPAS
jgi:hypothetical protein